MKAVKRLLKNNQYILGGWQMAEVKEIEVLTPDVREKLTEIIERFKGTEGCLISVLHETQEYLGYVPYDVQKFVAEGLNIPLSEVYGVVTFYSRFTIKPTGKYKIGVCLGTACYVKGSDKVLAKVEEMLGIKAGQTSHDGLYSIEATRCIGACGLAPVITINEDVYGKLAANQVADILAKYHE